MPIQSHLLPGETITFHLDRPVTFGKSRFMAYVTSQRLILYGRRGLLQRDDVVSWRLRDISNVQYQEKGFLTKRGILRIAAQQAWVDLVASAQDMRQLYQRVLAAAHTGSGPT